METALPEVVGKLRGMRDDLVLSEIHSLGRVTIARDDRPS